MKKQLYRNTAKILPIKMHLLRHKFISILLALGQKKMSLKSDQLEVGGSVQHAILTLLKYFFSMQRKINAVYISVPFSMYVTR